MAARTVQTLAETIDGPLFRRIIAQGMTGDDVICLTMPELKGGIVRSHLIGSLAQKRKALVDGPLSSQSDQLTVKRATKAVNAFLNGLRDANSDRWDAGRSGGLCINIGLRACFLLFAATIEHARTKHKALDLGRATPDQLAGAALEVAKPVLEYLETVSDDEFMQRFAGRYGSGGPLDYFFELAQLIWEKDKSFAPDGLANYLESKDEKRIQAASDTIKFIENRVTDIIVDYFKKLHGDNYWTYIGTKEIRVKAYERQQEDAPEKQLALEAYLDFIDKKKIIEKSENWNFLKIYFDIPLPNEKGLAKNLKWMDRLNELRRVVAHPHKRVFKADDLQFLEWIRKTFEERLLSVSAIDPVSGMSLTLLK
jgi:hypothetical protein